MVLRQLKQKDLPALRRKWYNEQDGYCSLFGNEYPIEDCTLDHQHKLKAELPDESGKGLCRGVLHKQANSIEGKITNAFKRYGGDKHTDIITFLRNLADYLESNKIHTEEQWIHPTEEPKKQKLMKSSYNKLVRTIAGKQKVHPYNGTFTKQLESLFEKYGITPEFQRK